MSAEVGTVCQIGPYTWFGHAGEEPPAEGDFLRTATGSCYRIDTARNVGGDRRRFMFACTRLGKDAVELGDPGVHTLKWDPR